MTKTRFRFIFAVLIALLLVSCSQATPTVVVPAPEEPVDSSPAVESDPYPYPVPQYFFTSPYPAPEGFDSAETVDWEAAAAMINGGEVATIVQAVGYQDVYLTLKDGRYIKSMQPMGGVETLIASCGDACGDTVVINQ